MNQQFEFRALLLRMEDILSNKDRKHLHFLMSQDVPRYLLDDPSFKGTLTIFEALLDKSIISHQDCNYLIAALDEIHCYVAADLLRGLLVFLSAISITHLH